MTNGFDLTTGLGLVYVALAIIGLAFAIVFYSSRNDGKNQKKK